MDSATASYDDEDYADTYWRRRVIALGAVLLTVGAVVWSCNGDEERVAKNAAVVASPSGGPSPAPSPAAPSAAPPMVALPTVTVTVTRQATVAPPPRPGDACSPADVVVGVTASKSEYPGKEAPAFRLTVVNTGKLDCTFDVGPQRLVAKVRSGSDKVWSSAYCAVQGSSIQMLQRGIPYASTLVWDRRRADEGCDSPRRQALPGTYVLQLEGGGVKSPKSVFALR